MDLDIIIAYPPPFNATGTARLAQEKAINKTLQWVQKVAAGAKARSFPIIGLDNVHMPMQLILLILVLLSQNID